MSPDSFSGFGIRTLARGQGPYNPLSYHNGTVWPHDNSLIAMGFSNYGMQKLAAQVLSGEYDACRQFRHYRLPELYCGMGRNEGDLVVSYPVSCSPQAWASGAFFLMLRACLGLYPDAPGKTLKIVNPHLPEHGVPQALQGGDALLRQLEHLASPRGLLQRFQQHGAEQDHEPAGKDDRGDDESEFAVHVHLELHVRCQCETPCAVRRVLHSAPWRTLWRASRTREIGCGRLATCLRPRSLPARSW